jgi:glycine cleavage system H lipoate-binding protein
MKSAMRMTMMMAMLFFFMTAIFGAQKEKGASGKSELELVCSPELESLALRLAGAFMQEEGNIHIQVNPLADQEIYGRLQQGTLALVGKDCVAGLDGEQYFKMVVGRDAIVPVMNENHPQKDLILERGISPEAFSRIFTEEGQISWGEVLHVSDQHPVQAYAPGINGGIEYLVGFLQIQANKLKGLEMMEPELMVRMIGENPNSIGFCKLSSLMDMEKKGLVNDIALIPVDVNGDGRIGAFEEIDKSTSSLSHALFVGRFPKALYSRIYVLTDEQPAGAGEMAFVEWLISNGQETLASAGILELGYGERNSRMQELTSYDQAMADVPVSTSPARVYLVVAGFLLLAGFLVLVLARFTTSRRQASAPIVPIGKNTTGFPGGFFFDKSHTWAFMEKSGEVRIGMDHFLQDVCGSFTRVQMKKPGETVKRGDSLLTLVQNGKRLEIKSPLSGVVREQNEDLMNDASLLNNDPYADGWVMVLEPSSWLSELKFYFMGQVYTDWLKTELVRLKEFFTSRLKLDGTKEASLVMQDGGEISAGILESFGPEVWEEFQEGFINRTR